MGEAVDMIRQDSGGDRRWLDALLCGAVILGGSQAAAEEVEDLPASPPAVQVAENAHELADGAKAFVCDDIGFLSFVWGIDEELRSRQFPGATVQYASGLIVIAETLEIHGITTMQSAYLARGQAGTWDFSGFRGTTPVSDRCTDITADLAESFVDLALAASWGMSEVSKRIGLFDALEDDLRTRLELAEFERDAVTTEVAELRREMDGLETELVSARMAVCEMATQTHTLLTRASFDGETGVPPAFGDLLAETAALTDCIQDTVLVNAPGEEKR
jgi:hypothetical protein